MGQKFQVGSDNCLIVDYIVCILTPKELDQK